MTLRLVEGSPIDREQKYDITGSKGLFVSLQGQKCADDKFGDVSSICKPVKPLKLELRAEYDPFGEMEKVINNELKEKKISDFIVCVLQAKSTKFGTFQLQNSEDICCGGEHKYEDHCKQRRIADLVRRIQQLTGDLSGKPKIFIIETLQKERSLGKELADKYIPRGSDTFVFYRHSRDKFLLVNSLCALLQSTGSADLPSVKDDELKREIERGIAAEQTFDNFFVTLTTVLHKTNSYVCPQLSSTLRKKLRVDEVFNQLTVQP